MGEKMKKLIAFLFVPGLLTYLLAPSNASSFVSCSSPDGEFPTFANNPNFFYGLTISTSNTYDPKALANFTQDLATYHGDAGGVQFPCSPYRDPFVASGYYVQTLHYNNGIGSWVFDLNQPTQWFNIDNEAHAQVRYGSNQFSYAKGSVSTSVSGDWIGYFKWTGSGRPPGSQLFSVGDNVQVATFMSHSIYSLTAYFSGLSANATLRDSFGDNLYASGGGSQTGGRSRIVSVKPDDNGIYAVRFHVSGKASSSDFHDDTIQNEWDSYADSYMYCSGSATPLNVSVDVTGGDPGEPNTGQTVSCDANVAAGSVPNYVAHYKWSIGQELYSPTGVDGSFQPVNDGSTFSVVGDTPDTATHAKVGATFASGGWYRVQIVVTVTWINPTTGDTIGPVTSDPNTGWIGR